MIKMKTTVREIGIFKIDEVYHGTYEKFDVFSHDYLESVGFHFGDLRQAEHFSTKQGPGGRIIRASLTFQNLLDIGEDDWGWIDCRRGAFQFFIKLIGSGIPIDREAFAKILGLQEWSLASMPPQKKMSAGERHKFAELLRTHDFDGVRYINKFEPPGETGGTAYFVLDASQILIKDFYNL